MKRNKFTCAARDCEGCSVCEPEGIVTEYLGKFICKTEYGYVIKDDVNSSYNLHHGTFETIEHATRHINSQIGNKNQTKFKELVYELAFGDDAINREYTDTIVLNELRRFSDEALRAEKLEELLSNIINVHSAYFDRHQRDWPVALYNAVKEADDYLNGDKHANSNRTS